MGPKFWWTRYVRVLYDNVVLFNTNPDARQLFVIAKKEGPEVYRARRHFKGDKYIFSKSNNNFSSYKTAQVQTTGGQKWEKMTEMEPKLLGLIFQNIKKETCCWFPFNQTDLGWITVVSAFMGFKCVHN